MRRGSSVLLGSTRCRLTRTPHILAFLHVLRAPSLPVTIRLALFLSLLLFLGRVVIAALMIVL
jgi:hypothetical protein